MSVEWRVFFGPQVELWFQGQPIFGFTHHSRKHNFIHRICEVDVKNFNDTHGCPKTIPERYWYRLFPPNIQGTTFPIGYPKSALVICDNSLTNLMTKTNKNTLNLPPHPAKTSKHFSLITASLALLPPSSLELWSSVSQDNLPFPLPFPFPLPCIWITSTTTK